MLHCLSVTNVIQARIEKLPVDEVIGCFKTPGEEHIVIGIAIADRVACWKETPSKLELETDESEGLVHSVDVDQLAAKYVAWLARTQ